VRVGELDAGGCFVGDVAFLEVVFFTAVAFLAVAFLAVAFFAADAFLAAAFFAAVAFLAVAFFAADAFLAAAPFLAAALVGMSCGSGPTSSPATAAVFPGFLRGTSRWTDRLFVGRDRATPPVAAIGP